MKNFENALKLWLCQDHFIDNFIDDYLDYFEDRLEANYEATENLKVSIKISFKECLITSLFKFCPDNLNDYSEFWLNDYDLKQKYDKYFDIVIVAMILPKLIKRKEVQNSLLNFQNNI